MQPQESPWGWMAPGTQLLRPALTTVDVVEILKELLSLDPSIPRLTCYDETTGGRIDLSATTLDNWASKIANMLHDEFDLELGDPVCIDLPAIWPAACLVVGCERAGMQLTNIEPLVVFTTIERLSHWEEAAPEAYLTAVTDDPFGRGVVESGGKIPPGVVDFGPEVRLYPDAYLGQGSTGPNAKLFENTTVDEALNVAGDVVKQYEMREGARALSTGWLDKDGQITGRTWGRTVLSTWLVNGTAVIVRGGNAARMQRIAEVEKITHTID